MFAALECAEEGANFDTLGLPVLKDDLLFDYFPRRGFGRIIGWGKREALLLAFAVQTFAEADLPGKADGPGYPPNATLLIPCSLDLQPIFPGIEIKILRWVKVELVISVTPVTH
jgi:hypothetical protein